MAVPPTEDLLAEGLALHRRGAVAEAAARYAEVLRNDPGNADAHYYLGAMFCQQGRFSDGAEHARRSLAADPRHVRAHVLLARALSALERYEEALASFDRAIAVQPDFARAHGHRADVLSKLGRCSEALGSYDRALALDPDFAEDWFNRGGVLVELGQHSEALSSFDRAIALRPDFAQGYLGKARTLSYLKRDGEALGAIDRSLAISPNSAEAWVGRGYVLIRLKRPEEAIGCFDRALSLETAFCDAWVGRGNALFDTKRFEDALTAHDRALALAPDLPEAWLGRGNALCALKQYGQADRAFDRALALKADLAEAWLGAGNVAYNLRHYDDASTDYDRALALKPELASGWLGRGNVLYERERFDEALAAYDKALSLEPRLAAAWLGCGNAFDKLKRHEAAAAAYARVIELEPAQPFAKGMLLREKMLTCDWKGIEALTAEIEADILSRKLSTEPFGWLAASKSMRSSQLCAELYCSDNTPRGVDVSSRAPLPEHGTIRIGYSAGEFNDHATSYLIVGLLELHDRSRFQIYAVDNGWDDHSEVRQRINAAVHQIINIRDLDDVGAVNLIRENEIDILVNLNGYSGRARPGVFALRAAPVQVNYLGFPGTLGAPYIDYIIADAMVLPPDHQGFYDEKVVYLPDCYQVNDRLGSIGMRLFTRAECSLPEKGFVFCCFNNNYKITPDVFSLWTRILNRVSGSVLWLLEDNAAAASNLRMEASARGVDPDRLVFAKRAATPDHMARHRLADLFLDTSPYGAHTTGSDALRAGLPLLTQLGETFPGRVAASLLHAVGLPELVAATEQAYEQRAVELATNPDKLAAMKLKLSTNRLSAPLFDTERFRCHIERAYITMAEIQQRGEIPRAFAVSQSL